MYILVRVCETIHPHSLKTQHTWQLTYISNSCMHTNRFLQLVFTDTTVAMEALCIHSLIGYLGRIRTLGLWWDTQTVLESWSCSIPESINVALFSVQGARSPQTKRSQIERFIKDKNSLCEIFANVQKPDELYFRRLSLTYQLWYWPQILALTAP